MAVVLKAYSYEAVAVSTTAIGFTASKYMPTGEHPATRVLCTVETNTIRVRFDGTDPTASEGHLFIAGAAFVIDGPDDIHRLRMIRASADATVRCTFMRE